MEKDRPRFSRASLYPELSFSMSPWIVGPAVTCPEASWEGHSVCAQDDASRGWCTFILELLGTQRAHQGGVQGSCCWVTEAQSLGHRDFHGPRIPTRPGVASSGRADSCLSCVHSCHQTEVQFSRQGLGGDGFPNQQSLLKGNRDREMMQSW